MMLNVKISAKGQTMLKDKPTGIDEKQKAILSSILRKMNDASSFFDIEEDLKEEILELLQAEQITIYRRNQSGDIHARIQGGVDIRLNMSSSSIAGYVAMSQQTVILDDVYDEKLLNSVHPGPPFSHRY